MAYILEYINNIEATASTAASLPNTEYEIPINLVLVTDADGGFHYSGLTASEIITDFSVALEITNSYFTDNFHFSLCSHVVSDPAPELQSIDLYNTQDAQGLQAISYRTDAINFYIILNTVATGYSGQAQYPWDPAPNNMISLQYSLFSTTGDNIIENLGIFIAHELGHYESLEPGPAPGIFLYQLL
jgi:hypothetical protein